MDYSDFNDLVERIAHRLPQFSDDVREASLTVRLGDNAVRVGDHDITKFHEPHLSYRISCSRTGEEIIRGIEIYDIALKLVRMLNRGMNPRSKMVLITLENHFEFVNTRNQSDFHLNRANQYMREGFYTRHETEMDSHNYYYDRSQTAYLRAIAP